MLKIIGLQNQNTGPAKWANDKSRLNVMFCKTLQETVNSSLKSYHDKSVSSNKIDKYH